MSDEIYIDGKLLKDLKVADLKRACKARNISQSGNKATLVKHLKAAVELDNLKKTALNSEGAVQPNSSIADNSADNDFIKQYLENQRKMLQKQHHRFSSASEAESEDDIPKKQVAEAVGSSLTGAMSPPTRVRQLSKEITKTEDQEVSTDNKKDEGETVTKVDQASKRKSVKTKKTRSSTSELSSPEPTEKNVQRKSSTMIKNDTSIEDTSKDVVDTNVVTLKSVDSEPEKQLTEDETDSGVQKTEEVIQKNMNNENENIETAPEIKETASERSEMGENSSIGNDEESKKREVEETNNVRFKESKDVIIGTVPLVENANESEANNEEKKIFEDERNEDQASLAKPLKETNAASSIQDNHKQVQQDEPSEESDVPVSTMEDETVEPDEATNTEESEQKDTSKMQDSVVEISMDVDEDHQLHAEEKKDKADEDLKDVEGIPVISVDTDVLMEEVEELDYDDVDLDKSETHEQEEDQLGNVKTLTKKKRKHIQKETDQKPPSKSEQPPETKKQRKLKKSSRDSTSAPSTAPIPDENNDKDNKIEAPRVEKPSEEEVNNADKSKKNEKEKKEGEPKGALRPSRRRISIKKNPIKRSIASDQPREKKRKWGKSTAAVDASQINISADSLKNIIEVKQDEIRDAVVDFERSSDEDKEKVESEEEGEIVEEVIVEEVVPEDHEDKEPVVGHDKRKGISVEVVTSDVVKEKPVSESRTVKMREKRPLQKPDSITTSEPQPKKASREVREVVSPARLPLSCVVHVSNLVRPFALTQLKQLLNENGDFIPDSFWINTIKSHCFVTYESKEVAAKTREALHQLRWPTSSPKKLVVEFSTQEEVDWNKREQPERPVKPHKKKRTELENGKEATMKKLSKPDDAKPVERDDRREHRDHERQQVREDIDNSRRGRERQRSPPPPEQDRRHGNGRREHESARRREEPRGNSGQDSRNRRNLREWDMHKLDQDEEMRRMRQQEQRDPSPEPRRRRREEPPKPAPEPPKLLDDLFRKTEATPCVYWLPLTDEQIVERKNEQEKQRVEQTKLRREGDDGAEAKKQEVGARADHAVPSKRRDESREGDRHRDERRKDERMREGDGRREIDQSRRRGEGDQSRERRETDQSRIRRETDQLRGRREADQSRGRREADQSRGRRETDQSRGRREDDQPRGRREEVDQRIRRHDERPTMRREPETKSSKSTQEIRSKQIRRRKPSSSSESSDSSSDSSDSSSNSSSSSSSSDSEEESPSRSR